MNAHPSPATPAKADSVRRIVDESPITVLHVDDEMAFTDLVSIYLEREDSTLEVSTEHSVEAALTRLEDDPIDCIVSDYQMPGRDGLEFLETVRTDYPELPFILFTGKGDESIASNAISTGVTDYLQKQSGTDQYTVLANRITNAVKRYRAEQEVERGFQALENAREGISLLDENGTFEYVNQAYAETYGYKREELIGDHWERLYPEEHVDQVYEEILPAVPREGRWRGESIHRTKDGDRLIIDHALSYTDTGRLICLIRDITEAKQTEQALRYERTRFELFVETVEEYAIFSLDPEGYVTSWNQGAERIKGYTQEEILGEHVSTFYPPEKAETGYPAELLKRALETGSATEVGWRVRKDGTQFRAQVVISAVYDDDGTHRGFLKVTQDLSDGTLREDPPEHANTTIEQALDMLDDVFYILDTDGTIAQVTDRATELTGYSRDELRTMEPAALFVEADRTRVRAEIEEALTAGQAELEATIHTRDGREIPMEFRKRRLTDENDTVIGVAGIGRDITERKRRERQLKRQADQFEQFGSIVAHDLRTPLNIAEGRVELAHDTGDNTHLIEAKNALERLDELIGDVSSVMRQGELVNEYSPVDIGTLATTVWEPLQTNEERLTVDPSAPTIQAGEQALARLLENLLVNAIEHGGPGVTVEIGGLPDGFYIADDGPGIPDADRTDVLTPGFSTKDEGTGFGLASVRQIATAHGWEMTVTESRDGGAKFEFSDVDRIEG